MGSHIIQERFQATKDIGSAMESAKVDVLGLLKQTVRPEFLNRIDDTIMFTPLSKDNIVEIGVYSSNGQLIDYQNISLPFGVRNYTLNTAKYKTGVYIINIKGETLDQSIQVIKE